MSYLFTSESVSEGHPDKVADAIRNVLGMVGSGDVEAIVDLENAVAQDVANGIVSWFISAGTFGPSEFGNKISAFRALNNVYYEYLS